MQKFNRFTVRKDAKPADRRSDDSRSNTSHSSERSSSHSEGSRRSSDRGGFSSSSDRPRTGGFGGRSSSAGAGRTGGQASGFAGRSASRFGGRASGAGSSFGGRSGGSRFGGRSGGSSGGRFGGNGGGSSAPRSRGRRIEGTNISVDQLINKVNDEAFIKPTEHVIRHQFSDFKMDPRIKENVRRKGYISPTPIQDQSIPVGLDGKDVIGIANTGTGKTAAFLIPLINKMLADPRQKALILAPTRELAFQIADELKVFAFGMRLNAVLCIGGSDIVRQGRMLKSQYNFIIGTPGRILDILERRWLSLEGFQNVVLDEADRMVDMGFINDIRLILSKVATERQSFFFTATLDKKVEELIRTFMKEPVKVSVKMRDTSANIEQDIVHVPPGNAAKVGILLKLLEKPEFDKVLIFGRTKFGVAKIAKALVEAGIKADCIHGDKSQGQRLRALSGFKKDDTRVLVATDVAARGLDINDVSHVINFDIPACYEDYVHRIGRTGRADKKGVALTFVTK